jgi:hypothetical protein
MTVVADLFSIGRFRREAPSAMATRTGRGYSVGKGEQAMNETERDLVQLLQEQEREQVNDLPPLPPPERPSIHFTELPEALPGSPIATEWNCYRRIVERLLAEGQEGKWLLIKNEEIIGIWETEEEANEARVQSFLMQPVLMKQVLTWEPKLRIGYNRLCRS